MRGLVTTSAGSQSGPLCCKYLLVMIETLSVEMTDEAGALSDRTLSWAFGVLAGGECDVLDAWAEPLSPGVVWQQRLDDFRDRGVENIRFVAGVEPSIPQSALQAIYPGTTLLTSIGQLLPQPLRKQPSHHNKNGSGAARTAGASRRIRPAREASVELASKELSSTHSEAMPRTGVAFHLHEPSNAPSARYRRTLAASRRAMEEVQRIASRAVARHGPFLEVAAATEFALNALRRAERRIHASGAASTRLAGDGLAANCRNDWSRAQPVAI